MEVRLTKHSAQIVEEVLVLKFYIEFKKPLLKSIYCKEIKATDLEEAEKLFTVEHPDSQIIKIEGRS